MTKKQLEKKVRLLTDALLALVYEDGGRWRSGIKDDYDVSDVVKPALSYNPQPKKRRSR